MDGTRYQWPHGTSNVFIGTPSRRLFDPSNGYQVLFLINTFASFIGKQTIQDGKKIEHHLYNYLPLEVKSEISVFNWLKRATFL